MSNKFKSDLRGKSSISQDIWDKNDGMETIKVLEGWKQIIISTRIYSLSKQEKPFKQLFKTNQRAGLTINLFGKALIKDNSRDKQSNNPPNYLQKGWKHIRETKWNLRSNNILLNLVCFQHTLRETFRIYLWRNKLENRAHHHFLSLTLIIK